MHNSPTFGAWLRQARIARDLTQEALAEQIGCSTQTVRAFERDRRRPSREMVARIASILDVPEADRGVVVRLARERQPAAGQAPVAAFAESFAPAIAAPLRVRAPSIALVSGTLIGRHGDLGRLRAALLDDGRRLVTLLGHGGIGKTRLALQAAADFAAHFRDGVVFVALAPIADPADIVTAIAQACDCPFPAAQSPEAALRAFLRDRAMLLMLDNIEHLLHSEHGDYAGTLLAALLHDAPQLSLLVTSRERLRLRDEWVIELAGLALPADERPGTIERSEAAQLFEARARQVASDFAITAHNRAAVAQICRLLGGAPLAIELAASWVRAISCEEIAVEIAHGADMEALADRDLPARHRSLHAVIEHSWQLLSAEEQRVLMHMAVFLGGGSRDAIAAVLAPVDPPAGTATSPRTLLALLAALVDKSLLRRRTDDAGATRYDLHDLVRQYVVARLADRPAEQAAERHAAFYAGLVARLDPMLKSARQKQAVQALIAELDNIRAAWRWACERHSAPKLLQMFFTLDWFYEVQGWNTECASLFAHGSTALRSFALSEVAPRDVQTCYWLLVAREGWHTLRRDPGYAARQMQAAAAALRQVNISGGLTYVIKGIAYLHIFAGDYARAEALLDEAVALAEQSDDAWSRSVALVVRGVLETLRSDAATARQALHTALATARSVGDPRHVSLTLNYFGVTALNLGQLDEAERACRECLVLAAEHRDRFQMSLALQTLGRIALLRGDHAASDWLLNESLSIAREIGDRWLEAQALGQLGRLADMQGNRARARQRHRSAVAAAAAAPPPIALDELVALAQFELIDQPDAALAALMYAQRHPLTRPAARARAAEAAAAPEQRARAEALAASFPPDRPSALLSLFS
jgi:predicted ATPase/transcriptional regulator with XRE-family HTH domain